MRSYVSRGEIPFTDVGHNGRPRIRILEDDLRQFMDGRRKVAEDRATRTPATAV
jgi:hypothetical protein